MTLLSVLLYPLYCHLQHGGGKIGYSIYHLSFLINPVQRYNNFLEYARKNAEKRRKKMQKDDKLFAYIEKKQYLCSQFGAKALNR